MRCDWPVPGGEKAPDKWAWLSSANQRPPPVFSRKVECAGAPPPYLPSTSDDVSKDHPGNFGVLQQNVEKCPFRRCV